MILSEILKICGIALITISITAVLKSQGSALAQYLPQISAVIILIGAVGALFPIISFIKSLASGTKSSSDSYITVMFIAAGISVVSKVIVDICKENNLETLKNSVEFATNAEILVLSLPLIKDILKTSFEALSI